MNYACLHVSPCTQEQADIVVALLPEDLLLGSEVNDQEALFYFPEHQVPEAEVKDALAQLGLSGTWENIPLQNWNAEWEANFSPLQMNEELGVRAEFHPPFSNLKYDMVITPKMSFGTGHHATTRMMTQFLMTIPCANKSVFDFGTGTGILAIYAAMRGANPILGTDNDAWSIENAQENTHRNGFDHIQIATTPCSDIHDTFDIIIANINLNVLLDSADDLSRLLKPDGDLFLSGILITDRDQLVQAFEKRGFTCVGSLTEQQWLALHCRKASL